jgi:Domain of Unknown Function (DUF1080).
MTTSHTTRFTKALATPCIILAALVPSLWAAEGELPPREATEQWEPVPEVVSVPLDTGVPSDAVVLFDGRSLEAWEPVKAGSSGWEVKEGTMSVVSGAGAMKTKRSFGSIQLHLEFRTPHMPDKKGQSRANSGVFFMGLYELQILDSYQNPTYVNGQAGSIYKQYAPLVNASRKPGEWQTYDVIFTAPVFNDAGELQSPAYMTVLHNGVLVQNHVALKGPTLNRGYPAYTPHPAKLPLELQDHRNPMFFRNIWVREL